MVQRGTGDNTEVGHRTEPLSTQTTLRAGGPIRTTEMAGMTVSLSDQCGLPANEAAAQKKGERTKGLVIHLTSTYNLQASISVLQSSSNLRNLGHVPTLLSQTAVF